MNHFISVNVFEKWYKILLIEVVHIERLMTLFSIGNQMRAGNIAHHQLIYAAKRYCHATSHWLCEVDPVFGVFTANTAHA